MLTKQLGLNPFLYNVVHNIKDHGGNSGFGLNLHHPIDKNSRNKIL
jgi:hypothetical protein